MGYIENPEKTDNPKFLDAQGLDDVISYAVSANKTEKTDDENAEVVQSFVSGINCMPATARAEMLIVKKQFGKENGTVAYHGYQSFARGEVTPEQAHEIGVRLAQKLWGEKYQVVVATHLDKESHLHSHFVLNTVSFLDGKKYHRTAKDYHDMQAESDNLCREYGLSVVANPQYGQGKQYGEWKAEQEHRPTWRGLIKADIDTAIRQSMTERQFFDALKKLGYEIKIGKDISVKPQGKERFVRLMRNFGEEYSLENIRSRILSQSHVEKSLSELTYKTKAYQTKGKPKRIKKFTGFRALYIYYCYLLGVFPKSRPKNNKRLHFLLREDLIKLDNISKEARLLCEHHIDSYEQLSLYRSVLETEIKTLPVDRKRCNFLRREVHLCNDIVVRSGVMQEKIKAVREDENSQREDMKKYEHIRRRSGTNR